MSNFNMSAVCLCVLCTDVGGKTETTGTAAKPRIQSVFSLQNAACGEYLVKGIP